MRLSRSGEIKLPIHVIDKEAPLKWEVRQRLTLLEATVLWTDCLGTRDLVNAFGISRVQASNDIGLYLTLFPGSLLYDRSRKCYRAGSSFQPHFLRGTPEEFLHLLKSAAGPDGPVLVLLGELPPVEIVSPLERELRLDTLQAISQAIRESRCLQLDYQSLNREAPVTHTLVPHALVYNGYRWHMRAYSESHGEFRDFVLARIQGKPLLREIRDQNAAADTAWQTYVTLRIGPHPGLTPAQRAVIEDDFGMQQGEVTKRLRAALLPYFLRLMHLEIEPHAGSAREQQIVLLNAEELRPWVRF
ncbi:WYL domain-containing protein [Thermithiobacillus plumbiphilus]|uniref:WYL domain-containing protein n=1 Tax=Thermithiobacillus plumbiphilus TaxID=1729899 RepID=A0ABU9D5P0_9PROT